MSFLAIIFVNFIIIFNTDSLKYIIVMIFFKFVIIFNKTCKLYNSVIILSC